MSCSIPEGVRGALEEGDVGGSFAVFNYVNEALCSKINKKIKGLSYQHTLVQTAPTFAKSYSNICSRVIPSTLSYLSLLKVYRI